MSYGVDGVHVAFGDVVALAGVSIDVPPGQVTAVVGGDGAGKSTLLRVLAGLVAPGAGTVRTLDQRDLGYQPATSGVWGHLTVQENLDFVGASFGLTEATIRTRSADLLARAGLADAAGLVDGTCPAGCARSSASCSPSSTPRAWSCWTSRAPGWTRSPGWSCGG